jgi:tetratricopeptide (TPR) repeat protein
MTSDLTAKLIHFLQFYADPKKPLPILWVGAGASAAAGYPTLNQLKKSLQEDLASLEGGGDPIESYIQQFSRVDLMNVLEIKFGEPRPFAQLHLAIAQMAGAGLFRYVITTNYDRLIENALESLNVPYTIQIISQNLELSSSRSLTVIKLHGDRSNWKEAVLDAASYTQFEDDEPLVIEQLDLIRRGHPVIFLGCSMQDSRILNWLRGLSSKERSLLRTGRVLITKQDWVAIPLADRQLLQEANIQSLLLDNHTEISELLVEAANKLAPIAVDDLAFELIADEHQWAIKGPNEETPLHHTTNPLTDEAFIKDLAELKTLSRQSVREHSLGTSNQEAKQWEIAKVIGERLTSVLLSDEAKRAVCARINQVDKPRSCLIIRVIDNSLWSKQALALPWELIMPQEDTFAVYQGQLNIVREVIVNEAPILAAPTSPLTLAVSVSAPEDQHDQNELSYEEESYRLARALDPVGKRPAFAELGELEDLVELVERVRPSVIHFSGHGLGENLIFENEEGFPHLVPASELTRRLNERLRPSDRPGQLPKLFFLSYFERPTRFNFEEAEEELESPEARPTFSLGAPVATALHRSGFVQVVDFPGPNLDVVRTQAEETFYSALAKGETTLQAVAMARAELSRSFESDRARVRFPLAWIHLHFYHRGPDRPLAVKQGEGPQELVQAFHRHAIEVGGLPVLEFGFIGRRALQHEVRRKYRTGRRLFVVQGLGGIGKTSLATQLLHRAFASSEEDALVLRCEGLQLSTAIISLKDQAIEHGRRIEIEGWEKITTAVTEQFSDPSEAFEQIVLKLRRHRPQLIIYGDGVESLLGGPNNPQIETGEWLPETRSWWDALKRLSERGLLILLSTRYLWKELDPESKVFMDALSEGEIMRMFDSFTELAPLSFDTRERLISRIDGHPRTVDFLDKLAHARRIRLGRPWQELDAWVDLILPILPETSEKITTDILLEALWQLLTNAGREHTCTLLAARVPLPRQVIEEVGSAIDELTRFGLLTRHRIQRQLETSMSWENRWGMHSIVADYVRAKAGSETPLEAHRRLGLAYKNFVDSQKSTWSDVAESIYHLHSAGEGDLAWPLTSIYVGELKIRGDFLKALVLLEECERSQATGDNLASLLVNKAFVISETTGDSSKVIALLNRALSLATSTCTREAALRERGIQLRAESQFEEAESDLLKALRLTDINDGKQSLNYAICKHELAVTLFARGKFVKAQQLLEESLAIKASTCGKEHHLYASGLHQLGSLAMASQDYERAEPLVRQAVAIKRRTLGTFHPSYGHSLSVLAGILTKLGRDEEAKSLSAEAYMVEAFMQGTKANSAMFFAPDISYANRLRAVAAMLAGEGRAAEASKILDVLKTMGEDETLQVERTIQSNPKTDEIEEVIRYAERLTASGNHEEATLALQTMAEKLALSEASESAASGGLLCMLGNSYRTVGKYEQSEAYLRDALRIAGKTQGEHHPVYAICMASLAETLSYQGKHDESYPLYKGALKVLKNSVGVEHDLYCEYLRWFATALSIGTQLGEAEVKWRELVELSEKVQGEGYPQHARDLREVAALLARQNKFPEAYQMITKAIDIALKSHGSESEEYVEALWGQVHIGLLMGRPEALTSLPQTLALVNKYLSPENKSRKEALFVGMVHGVQLESGAPADEAINRTELADFYRQMMSVGKVISAEKNLLQERLKAVAQSANPLYAIRDCKSVLVDAEAAGEIGPQLSAHDLLAQILISVGRRDEALSHARQAKEIAVRIGHEVFIESAEKRIAEIESGGSNPRKQLAGRLVELSDMTHRSEFAEAVNFSKQIIEEAEALGAFDVLASTNGILSNALEMMGKTNEALVAAQRALSILQSLNHLEGIAHFRARVELLQSIGPVQTKVNELLYRAQLLSGSMEDALGLMRLCEEALPLAEAIGNRTNQWSAHRMLAEEFVRTGMKEEALDHAEQCLQIAKEQQNADLEKVSRQMLEGIKDYERTAADILKANFFRALRLNNQEETIAALKEVLSEAVELSIKNIACSTHWMLSQLYTSLDKIELAMAHVQDAIRIARDLGDDDTTAHYTDYLDQLKSRATNSNLQVEE